VSWVDIARAAARNTKKTSGPDGRPYLGIVGAINRDTERASVQHMYAQDARILHPYQGPNSWIRVAPEQGTGVMLSSRWDTDENEIVNYYNKYPERGLEGYAERRDIRRPLSEGEIEISSAGYAQTFYDARGTLFMRGGMVWATLDSDRMCTEAKAPWHHRMLAKHSAFSLGDEERFGTVVRPGKIIAPLEEFLTLGPIPYKEYYRSLASDRIPSGKLVEHHEGDVWDDLGLTPLMSAFTDLPLRGVSRWFTETGQKVEASVDNLGNVDVRTPPDAVWGVNLKIPTGKLAVNALLGADLTTGPAGPVNVTTTGAWATGNIFLDGLNIGRHAHVTPMGVTSIPVPG
jgi:hypothetical protein